MPRSLIAIIVAALLASSAPRATAQVPGPAGTPTGFHLLDATIGDVQAELKSGRLTCRALVGFYLNRIDAYDKNAPQLNAVQTVARALRSRAIGCGVQVIWACRSHALRTHSPQG